MSERNPADGWYPNVFSERIGLERDPRHQQSEASGTPPGMTKVAAIADVGTEVPDPPSLAEYRRVIEQRDALADEVKRLQDANKRLSAALAKARGEEA